MLRRRLAVTLDLDAAQHAHDHQRDGISFPRPGCKAPGLGATFLDDSRAGHGLVVISYVV